MGAEAADVGRNHRCHYFAVPLIPPLVGLAAVLDHADVAGHFGVRSPSLLPAPFVVVSSIAGAVATRRDSFAQTGADIPQ